MASSSSQFSGSLLVVPFGKKATTLGLLLGVIGSTAIHSRIFTTWMFSKNTSESIQHDAFIPIEADVDSAKNTPPPTPEPPPESPPSSSKEPITMKPTKSMDPYDSPPPPPAEAGKVLTALPDSNDDIQDMTDKGFQSGSENGAGYGYMSQNGTGTKPVTNPAASLSGTPGGTGTSTTAKMPSGPSLARSATLSGGADWSACPFPKEADADQINVASVSISVTVKPDGTPLTVRVLSDPGHGFGKAARNCAMSKRYVSGLDPTGNPITSSTPPIRVNFTR